MIEPTLSALYAQYNFTVAHMEKEIESADYDAHRFTLRGKQVLYRVAKITPTKIGQFVTLWKRNEQGKTQAYDSADSLDIVIIVTRSATAMGHFVFHRHTLIKQGIMSHDGKMGKMAIRVYPSWDMPTSPQAQKTQQWQRKHFIPIACYNDRDFVHAHYAHGAD